MLKKVVLLALLVLPLGAAVAQDKIAYFSYAEVVTALPEYKVMADSLQKFQNDVESEMTILNDAYTQKYEDFMAKSDSLSEPIKLRRMQEIQDVAQRAETFQQQMQEQYGQLQQALMTPIQQKVREAVDAVGKENNFLYILEVGQGTVIYTSPSAPDATALVKKKLGI